ncbi:MAG: hypothetical protein CV089_23500 [Nitrospira sp. WS110]|nr:hypothetical protein [Nitrospira sp. WS110]
MVNCLRTAANIATGLDFNLPSDRPLGNTAIGWNFASDKEAKFVRFEAPQGKNRNPSTQITDNKGISQMWPVGVSKIPAVVYLKNPKPITKTANLWVYVTLKSSKDFTQNWIDIGGFVLGGVAAIPGSIAEIGFRLPYVAARTTVPVIDHEPLLGYKPVSNEWSDFSGVICSLEKPFTVTASMRGSQMNVTYTLTPSSATTGQWTFRGTFKASAFVHAEGGGSYAIEGADTHTP